MYEDRSVPGSGQQAFCYSLFVVPGNIFYFDLFGVFLRLLLLTQLFEVNYFMGKKYYELIILGISFLLILIKVIFFNLPIIDLS